MADPTPPPAQGQMRVYDRMVLPLLPGAHRLQTSVVVAHDGGTETLPGERYFTVDGPRFTLSPDEVASLLPPRNGSGVFSELLPQIVLHRRTLPWERSLGAPASSGAAPGPGDPPPLSGDAPWLALLTLVDGEHTLLESIPLEQILPADALARLGGPAGVVCDGVEISSDVLAGILPSREELALLCHVRRVNVLDRASAGSDPDGWFAVVMSNRLPPPGTKCHCYLVSVEGRTDLVPAAPPASVEGLPPGRPVKALDAVALEGLAAAPRSRGFDVSAIFPPARQRLVVLHHWGFDAIAGGGTFRERMQALDVGLFGDLPADGGPPATDTGHVALDLHDRAGAVESVWYRGPLCAQPLTRDPLGPYHSADQARRISPETGAEDITYAAAFEAGRLIGASDGRLAQDLARWRRGAYDDSARGDTLVAVQAALPLSSTLAAALPQAVATTIAVGALEQFAAAAPAADASGLQAVAAAPGLNAQAVAAAWGIGSAADASAILKGTAPGAALPGAAMVAPPPASPAAALARLGAARAALVTSGVPAPPVTPAAAGRDGRAPRRRKR